jgi:hypothetical protein
VFQLEIKNVKLLRLRMASIFTMGKTNNFLPSAKELTLLVKKTVACDRFHGLHWDFD